MRDDTDEHYLVRGDRQLCSDLSISSGFSLISPIKSILLELVLVLVPSKIRHRQTCDGVEKPERERHKVAKCRELAMPTQSVNFSGFT